MSLFEDASTGVLTKEKLEGYLSKNQGINDVDSTTQFTPLIIAIRKGHTPTVRLLLDQGADANLAAPKNLGRQPLWHATIGYGDKLPMVKLLLGAKTPANPDVAATDTDGNTPLMNCIIKKAKLDVITELYHAGKSDSPKTIKRKDGNTAYTLAQSDTFSNPDAIKLFDGQGSPIDTAAEKRCLDSLTNFIKHRVRPGLEAFYPDGDEAVLRASLKLPAERASKLHEYMRQLSKSDGTEVETDLAVLALYDMIVFVDDSYSMTSEEGGERIKTMGQLLHQIAKIYNIVAEPGNGLRIRFFNSRETYDQVQEEKVVNLIDNHFYESVTRIGGELRKKILKPFVYDKSPMKRPLLVMIITDGHIEGERKTLLKDVLDDVTAQTKAGKIGNGPASVCFQFSRVGNDEGAKKLLHELDDNDKTNLIDTQDVNSKLEEHLAAGDEATVYMLIKLLLGPINALYNEMTDDDF